MRHQNGRSNSVEEIVDNIPEITFEDAVTAMMVVLPDGSIAYRARDVLVNDNSEKENNAKKNEEIEEVVTITPVVVDDELVAGEDPEEREAKPGYVWTHYAGLGWVEEPEAQQGQGTVYTTTQSFVSFVFDGQGFVPQDVPGYEWVEDEVNGGLKQVPSDNSEIRTDPVTSTITIESLTNAVANQEMVNDNGEPLENVESSRQEELLNPDFQPIDQRPADDGPSQEDLERPEPQEELNPDFQPIDQRPADDGPSQEDLERPEPQEELNPDSQPIDQRPADDGPSQEDLERPESQEERKQERVIIDGSTIIDVVEPRLIIDMPDDEINSNETKNSNLQLDQESEQVSSIHSTLAVGGSSENEVDVVYPTPVEEIDVIYPTPVEEKMNNGIVEDSSEYDVVTEKVITPTPETPEEKDAIDPALFTTTMTYVAGEEPDPVVTDDKKKPNTKPKPKPKSKDDWEI